jgi:hypothetical protein
VSPHKPTFIRYSYTNPPLPYTQIYLYLTPTQIYHPLRYTHASLRHLPYTYMNLPLPYTYTNLPLPYTYTNLHLHCTRTYLYVTPTQKSEAFPSVNVLIHEFGDVTAF